MSVRITPAGSTTIESRAHSGVSWLSPESGEAPRTRRSPSSRCAPALRAACGVCGSGGGTTTRPMPSGPLRWSHTEWPCSRSTASRISCSAGEIASMPLIGPGAPLAGCVGATAAPGMGSVTGLRSAGGIGGGLTGALGAAGGSAGGCSGACSVMKESFLRHSLIISTHSGARAKMPSSPTATARQTARERAVLKRFTLPTNPVSYSSSCAS
mmetsp:Transcript_7575/g.23575  ORF Transcript_7575/g.23575 Transcript_7575/m.23575 type:complete len:212 (+) Transcript_7575:1250-1885(+)